MNTSTSANIDLCRHQPRQSPAYSYTNLGKHQLIHTATWRDINLSENNDSSLEQSRARLETQEVTVELDKSRAGEQTMPSLRAQEEATHLGEISIEPKILLVDEIIDLFITHLSSIIAMNSAHSPSSIWGRRAARAFREQRLKRLRNRLMKWYEHLEFKIVSGKMPSATKSGARVKTTGLRIARSRSGTSETKLVRTK
jgi:hypothetical protein